MPAKQIQKLKKFIAANALVEIVIWEVEPPVPASKHSYKYRLAYVVDGTCVIRYDNEAGKGDHKHIGSDEVGITFENLEKLLTDFWNDIAAHRR